MLIKTKSYLFLHFKIIFEKIYFFYFKLIFFVFLDILMY